MFTRGKRIPPTGLSGASLETALTTAAHADHQANVTQQNHDRLRTHVDGITGTVQNLNRQQGEHEMKLKVLTETISQTQAAGAEHARAISLHARLLERMDDDTHAHPTEGDSAIEERLATVERLLNGNDEPVARDYMNDDWPRARPFQEDGELAARAAAEAEEQTGIDDDAQPTRQQRWWLHQVLVFHARRPSGGRITAFHGSPAIGATWLMRQLEERGYPAEDGAWREWAERWALAPDTNPHLTVDAWSLSEALRGEQRAHEATYAELVRMRRRAQKAEGELARIAALQSDQADYKVAFRGALEVAHRALADDGA